jgi:hypothetical protein
MKKTHQKTFKAVKRNNVDAYVLTSLVAFAATVIVTRAFLELTGYPQIGNDILHIAHALWGGLLLFVSVLLPMVLANRWAIQVSALLGGIGIGLFIDEVGKFITQANDYFFPPSLSIIYGFFLVVVFVYLTLRQHRKQDPRVAMYWAFDWLQDALDGDLDATEAARIETQLEVARQSDRHEIVALADTLSAYLQKEKDHLPAAHPDLWKRMGLWVDTLGQRLGRQKHRFIISGLLILWVIVVLSNITLLTLGVNLESRFVNLNNQVMEWREPLISIQVLVSGLIIAAMITWVRGNEERGLAFAISGFLISLVALQLLYFYLSQFSAISTTLLQLVFLQILVAYRRWYFE